VFLKAKKMNAATRATTTTTTITITKTKTKNEMQNWQPRKNNNLLATSIS